MYIVVCVQLCVCSCIVYSCVCIQLCVCLYLHSCVYVCTQLCMCSLFVYTGVMYVCMWNQSRISFLRNLAS